MYQGKNGTVIGREMHFCMRPVTVSRLWVFNSQSQRRIYPGTSNHGISPDNSVYYSRVVDPSQLCDSVCRGQVSKIATCDLEAGY